jgi:hypothetical protein
MIRQTICITSTLNIFKSFLRNQKEKQSHIKSEIQYFRLKLGQ